MAVEHFTPPFAYPQTYFLPTLSTIFNPILETNLPVFDLPEMFLNTKVTSVALCVDRWAQLNDGIRSMTVSSSDTDGLFSQVSCLTKRLESTEEELERLKRSCQSTSLTEALAMGNEYFKEVSDKPSRVCAGVQQMDSSTGACPLALPGRCNPMPMPSRPCAAKASSSACCCCTTSHEHLARFGFESVDSPSIRTTHRPCERGFCRHQIRVVVSYHGTRLLFILILYL